jgi:Na+/proline symporter
LAEILVLTATLVTLIAYLAVGFYFARRVRKVEEFYIAGMSLPTLPLFGTYLATYFSGVSMMGYPGDLYLVGVSALWLPVFWAIGTILLVIIALKFREYNIITPVDFMRARYKSSLLELLVGITTITALIFGLTVQFIVMGITWSFILGRPFSEGVIITALVIALITASGGLVSVAWSDILKAAIFIVAILVGGIWLITSLASPTSIVETISKTNPKLLDPIGGYGLIGIIFLFFVWTFGVAAHPQYLQRITAARDVRTALLQYTAWIIMALVYIILLFMALAARTVMPELPKGYTKDYVLLLFFKDYAPSIVYALWAAGLIAAALSTTDSVIQLATSTFNINVVKLIKPDISAQALMRLGRILPFILTFLVASFAIFKPAPVIYLAGYAWGLLAVGYFAPVFFGLYWRRANKAAALASVILGWLAFIIAQTLATAKMWPYPAPPVALGVIIAIVTFIIVSIITKGE